MRLQIVKYAQINTATFAKTKSLHWQIYLSNQLLQCHNLIMQADYNQLHTKHLIKTEQY